MSNIKPCIYERLTPKKIPYYIFWPFLSISLFVIEWFLVLYFKEKQYLWTELIFTSYIVLGPTIAIYGFYSFQERMIKISPIFWGSSLDFDNWLEKKIEDIFLLKSLQSWLITLSVFFMGIITVWRLGLPFENKIINILVVFRFSIVLFFCGHGAYMLIACILTLHEVVRLDPKLPFYLFSIPAISDWHFIYLGESLLISYGYLTLFFALLKGPYGLTTELQIWLTALAFIPLFIFAFSFYDIHTLMEKVKYNSVRKINYQIQSVLKDIKKNNKMADIEKLNKLMDIQSKIQSIREWPFELQGLGTFIIALIPALVQIYTIFSSSK